MPYAGGEYLYLTRSYGKHVGFIYGWKSVLLSGPSNRAALAIVSANYIGVFVSLNEQQHLAVAAGVVVLTIGVNYVGLVWAVRYQGLTVLLKTAVIAACIVAALVVSHVSPLEWALPTGDVSPGWGLVSASLLIFFAYEGWNRLGYAAGEMKNPRHVLPRSITIGLTITIALYVLLNLAYFRVLSLSGVRASNVVFSDFLANMLGDSMGNIASLVVAGLIVVSVTGSMTVSAMANGRLYLAMSKDGLFFESLNRVHPVFRTPHRALVLQGVISLVWLVWKNDFVSLIATAIFVNLVFYILSAHGLFILRRQRVGEENCYRVPLYPWLPLLFLLGLYGIFIARLVLDWQRAWVDLALLALGIPASILYLRYRK